MHTLEEQIDLDVPVQVAWEQLHRVHQYPEFVDGLKHAHAHGNHRAHLDIEVAGEERAFETAISDHGGNQVMDWRTLDGAHLHGTVVLRQLDPGTTQLQVRVEYEPEAVQEAFGGPHGFAQSGAIERTVRSDLAQFKRLVETDRPVPGGP
ncbi:SRPBCC family protein [Kitasatospora viridis]|uniref:Polyketide cyclase/dehydrase/lipid transport protein n=1 Tax=Kitasatospora viridis TaxID=281105 RepID=A0A561SFC3_9ACTN|nr:SRPBCC family protein [Kitasatospora viridis]TWF73507.1 polyketide cyclase/dehydrase/lipid transport protein [Kitasatospora viridis]